MDLISAQEMQLWEQNTIKEGVPSRALMLQAGTNAAEEILQQRTRFIHLKQRPIIVLCGKGNNGGDGFVVAQRLYEKGCSVFVHSILPPSLLRGDALFYQKKLSPFIHYSYGENIPDQFLEKSLLIDAILGTGFSSPLQPWCKNWIHSVNQSLCPVISLDLPSGIDPNTGKKSEIAIQANLTLTFGHPKKGLCYNDGLNCSGKIKVLPIGLSKTRCPIKNPSAPEFYTFQDAELFLPKHIPTIHKYQRGGVLLICGSQLYPGAAALAAESAMRSGAGIVYLYTFSKNAFKKIPNAVIYREINEDISQFSIDSKIQSILIGPGAGLSSLSRQYFQYVINQNDKKIIIDADAIRYVAEKANSFKNPENVIMTPHLGEAQILSQAFKVTIPKNPQDMEARIQWAKDLAESTQSVILLKGHRSIIASHDGKISINGSGTTALATAGSGDVLAGLITGLSSQMSSLYQATQLGAFIHGVTGEITPYGQYATIADDLPILFSEVFNKISSSF